MAGIPETTNSVRTVSQHRMIIWCIPRCGSTALLKCLSFLESSTTTDTVTTNIDVASEENQSKKKGCEVWFEPYNMSRFARIANIKLYKEELQIDSKGNEEEYFRAIKGVESMLPVVPGGLKNPNPYLMSLPGIKETLENSQSEMVVVKDVAAGIHGNFGHIPAGFRHVFLIRDPNQVFPSLRKLFSGFLRLDEDAMRKADLQKFHPFYAARHWFGELYDLWKHVKLTFDPNPLIIDTADLLVHPDQCLKAICEVMNVEYRSGLLEWDASRDVVKTWKNGMSESLFSDGVREALGMKRAFESSHFVAPSDQSSPPDLATFTPDCLRIAEECEGWYRDMHQSRFVPSIN